MNYFTRRKFRQRVQRVSNHMDYYSHYNSGLLQLLHRHCSHLSARNSYYNSRKDRSYHSILDFMLRILNNSLIHIDFSSHIKYYFFRKLVNRLESFCKLELYYCMFSSQPIQNYSQLKLIVRSRQNLGLNVIASAIALLLFCSSKLLQHRILKLQQDFVST